jgi:hypothetical protein
MMIGVAQLHGPQQSPRPVVAPEAGHHLDADLFPLALELFHEQMFGEDDWNHVQQAKSSIGNVFARGGGHGMLVFSERRSFYLAVSN